MLVWEILLSVKLQQFIYTLLELALIVSSLLKMCAASFVLIPSV